VTFVNSITPSRDWCSKVATYHGAIATIRETSRGNPDTGAIIGLRRGYCEAARGGKAGVFLGVVQAGVGPVRRSRVSIVRPCVAGKDTTPAAFLLACASGAESRTSLVR